MAIDLDNTKCISKRLLSPLTAPFLLNSTPFKAKLLTMAIDLGNTKCISKRLLSPHTVPFLLNSTPFKAKLLTPH